LKDAYINEIHIHLMATFTGQRGVSQHRKG